MDWGALEAILRDAFVHSRQAYWAVRYGKPEALRKDAIRDRLHRARERIDNALQALQE